MLAQKRPTYRIDNVESRKKILRRGAYWKRLSQGRYVGFRRLTKGTPGTWLARIHDPHLPPKKNKSGTPGGYVFNTFGALDDLLDGDRYDAAKKKAEAWFQHLDKGGFTSATTAHASCESYVDNPRMQKGERPALDAESRFKRYVYNDPIAKIDMAKLKATHVANWKSRLMAGGMQKATFNRNAMAFRAALNLALRRGAVESPRAWKTELAPFSRADGRRTLYLSMGERKRLIEYCNPILQPMLKLLALVPLRPGDAANLKVSHFHAKTKTLIVPAGKTKEHAIVLSGPALALVQIAAKDKLSSAWLFTRLNGCQWEHYYWGPLVKKAAEVAKLPGDTVAYSLRHAAITDMVSSGADLFDVAKMVGTSILRIEENYGHLQFDRMKQALVVLSYNMKRVMNILDVDALLEALYALFAAVFFVLMASISR